MSGDKEHSEIAGREPVLETVLACRDLDAHIGFFVGLGLRLRSIFPADEPRTAVVEGLGTRLRLEAGAADQPLTLRLEGTATAVEEERRAPGGTRVVLAPAHPIPAHPVPEMRVTRARDTGWHEGRAGMLYRDLVPGRQGGGLIASHIAIPAAGDVPDYVHYHRVAFQMIFCRRGWVRVVYEDQGPPITMRAGDCVLQPPGIRHRVLESSEGLEVVELGSPAAHPTLVDHELELPGSPPVPERRFDGQRFLFARAEGAEWRACPRDAGNPGAASIRVRESGMLSATGGRADVRVLRTGGEPGRWSAEGYLFLFVLEGRVDAHATETIGLEQDDALTLPPGAATELELAAGTELLAVRLDGLLA